MVHQAECCGRRPLEHWVHVPRIRDQRKAAGGALTRILLVDGARALRSDGVHCSSCVGGWGGVCARGDEKQGG
jgi:hypothetical protein